MDKRGFLKEGSFRIITSLGITCLIIPLFFMCLSHFYIRVSQAQDLSQIMLTDSMCVEIWDGVLVDNFEYWWNTYEMGGGWQPIDPVYPCGCFLRHYFQLYTVLDFSGGSRVLNAYTPSTPFLIEMLKDTPFAIMKKTAYTDLSGNTHNSIPADFNVLKFEVRAPLAIEQFNDFRFEVEVKTNNNGYAKMVIIPKNKTGGTPPVDALETVKENVETISTDQKNPSIIEIYIGSYYGDGEWHQVMVDLDAAVKRYSSLNDEKFSEILSVTTRGNQYRLDNIIFTKPCKIDLNNHAPHLFRIGGIYFQLYGQTGPNPTPEGRWIFAEDLDLGLTCKRTAAGGYLFPQIAGDADADGVPTSLQINPDGTIENQADITEESIALYDLDPNGRPDLASPRTPADEDLVWIFTMGDYLGPPVINDGLIDSVDLSSSAPFTHEETMTFPPCLLQQDGELIPNMLDSNGRYNVLSNPMFAVGVALANSGYDTFPNARKIVPHLGQVFEDMIVTCRVSDGTATDSKTFPISVVNYPVTNQPPIIEKVEDQVFEVGIPNYYQIVAHDPDLEDMLYLTYHATLNGLSYNTYGPWSPPWWYHEPIDPITGLITYTPTYEHTFDCTVTVHDPRGMFSVCEFTIHCKIFDKYPGTWFNHPPVIINEFDSPQTIRAGEMFIADKMDFWDPDGDKMFWSCNIGSVGDNGVYTFQSMFPGDYLVQITAYDIRGGMATTEFVINVTPWWSL